MGITLCLYASWNSNLLIVIFSHPLMMALIITMMILQADYSDYDDRELSTFV